MSDVAEPAPSLARLGYSERWKALFAPMADDDFVPGRVMRIDRGIATVGTGAAVVAAEPAAHLVKTTGIGSRFAVGDWVALAMPETHERAIIEAILPRTSAFVRRQPGERETGQVVAANTDTIFIVQALAPRGPNLRRLERELVIAWDGGATPVVVLTKADLVSAADADAMREAVGAIAHGVDIQVVSGHTGQNISALRSYAEDDATIALFGASGVGKSTLVNRLVGADVQATREIRDSDGRGRHATVVREMIFLPDSGVIIDTPGMRALALWDADDGVSAAFPDIEEFAHACQFRDCTHTAEPGCAVLAAAETGELTDERLDSYQRLRKELEVSSARQNDKLRAEKKREDKVFSKAARRYWQSHPGQGGRD